MIFVFATIMMINKYLIRNRGKQTNKISWLIILISYIIINIFPFENFIRFDTVDNVFNYYYPTGKIIKKYEYQDYAYIYFSLQGEEKFIYYINSNGWKFDNLKKRGQGKSKIFNNNFVTINKIFEKDVTGIVVELNFENQKGLVLDSLSTNFDEFVLDSNKQYPRYIYIAIIEKKLPDDYVITINGENYELFK